MISSPCRYCEKKDQPKENCARECKLLEEVQLIQTSLRDINSSVGFDIAEELRVATHAGYGRFHLTSG